MNGVFSWPTAPITARAVSVSVVPSTDLDVDRPRRVGVVPGGGGHPRVEPHVFVDPAAFHDGLEVGLQFGLPREELGPVIVGFEAVAVEVVADVDAGAGCSPPRSAHTGILLGTVYGIPASCNRIAANSPDIPQPMTTTGKSARAAAVDAELCHVRRDR